MNNVTHLFSPDDVTGLGTVDATAVIRRARRRRLPAQLATGGALVLALGGIGLTVQNVVGAQNQTAETTQAEGGVSLRYDDSTGFAAEDRADLPADQQNLCAQPIADVSPSPSGLVLTTDFPDAASGTEPITGTVTMTNKGAAAVLGYTAASPAITLSQDGVVTWHSNGVRIMSAAEIALAPGETYVYQATLTPVACGVEDDGDAGFRDDLPAAPAGLYQVSAAIDFMGDFDAERVTGPLETITLG